MGGLFAAMENDGRPLSAAGRQAQERAARFDAWLRHACVEPGLTYAQRSALLAAWRKAPEASYAHPREEHLIPLHVAFGAGKEEAPTLSFGGTAMGVQCSSVQWG